MNKNFNVVWNTARNMYVVASEFAQSNSRIKAQARAVGMASLLGMFSGSVLASYTPDVGAGESVTGETLNQGDSQKVYGNASDTVIAGGRQDVYGQSSGATVTLDGRIAAWDGGNIANVTSNGGNVDVNEGGTATDITFIDGGSFYTNGSAVATNVVLAENTAIASDTNATVSGLNGNGTAFSITNGVANNIILNTFDSDFYIYDNTTATNTTINDGYLHINSGGEADGITANGGVIFISNNAIANDVDLYSGATMYVSTDTKVTGTHEEGGAFYITDKTAKNVWLTSGGSLTVNADGTSIDTFLRGEDSSQYVLGIAKHTTISAGANNVVYESGTAEDSVINSSGKEWVYSGKSINAAISDGGKQIVSGGGIAENSTVNDGGTLLVCGGCRDVIIDDVAVPGVGTAINTTVNSGGTLWLGSEDATLDGTTLIKTGGILDAASGVISNKGVLNYEVDSGVSRTEGNIIQGSGGLKKTGQGTLLLTGVNTYAGATDVSDGTLWLSDSGVIGAPDSNTQLMTASSDDINVATGATFGGSGVANTDVNNSGNIAMSQNGDVGNTLTINGNYTGDNGNLYLNTQLGDDNAVTDKLVITGDSAGSTTVYVSNTGGEGALTAKGIEVIDVGGQSDGIFTQGNQVQIGLYEYRLYDDAGDWYLRSQVVSPVDPQYRADIGAYLGNQWMARNLQMQTLYDREGSQLRTDDGSMWMRFKAGDASSTAANGHVDIDNNYSQLQIGGDILSWDDSVQSLKAGLMVSYINADTDSTGNRGADGSQFSASGNVAGYNLGAYATWFADAKDHSGLYVDSWYQYGLYNNSVNNGDVGSKDYDSTASAVSLETGYRYDIGLENLNTVSLTPQAQVTWQQYKADAVVQNGTRIDGQNGDSWTTRLGLRVDGKLHKNTTSVIQPFAEVNWLHTSDDVAVSFDGAEVKQDLPADRAEVKVGIQANLNSQWSITGQVAGQKGRNDYGDLNGSLDVRYSW
ncbi:autotransporter outer membrane beta-barrel domain-containing protein [Citrobacter youngae]|uniref:autotransporter outer membrane beta-barrel domain-containing protein n=1 Tax=Citrobacter youngae TaxID=133448 RepID=UPI0039B4D6DF